MYLVPVLLAVDAPDAPTASAVAHAELHARALHVGAPRRLSALDAVTAQFDLRVFADRIELPPIADAPDG